MFVLKNWAAFIVARKYQPLTAVSGQTVYRLINWLFDFVLAPLLIVHLGALYGGAAYMVCMLTVDLLSVHPYDKVKKDVLGLEMLKALRAAILEECF